MKKSIQKLSENQSKIVARIQELEAKVEVVLQDHENIIKRLDRQGEKISGIETALIGGKIINSKALELHQSFKAEKLPNL